MQFIKNGPDIPEDLLHAHEEGRVIFFCGAGISYKAGLPSFRGLVNQIYKTLGTALSDIEKEAYKKGQYDATLDLLERRIPGRRLSVRNAITKILRPKLRRKGATETHAALLQLGRNRNGEVRLVTTNFDYIFHHVIAKSKVQSFRAPLLPIPKNRHWNGVVYLHGFLSKSPDESDLHKLVLTSGDFGLAYLIERWAARFVSELFRNYIVCFVGYSINDTVLRYMMDALAADRMLGENNPQAYALCSFQAGQEEKTTKEWKAKGVTPVLYEVTENSKNHDVLHQTLKAWSETYRDGIQGKESIVVNLALTKPIESTRQDDYVGRMLWALSDPSGLPAKRFAEFDPVPSLNWLEPISEDRYGHSDLSRFNVTPALEHDKNLLFSLSKRPAGYVDAPPMALVCSDTITSRWDSVMKHLAFWLTRHLNDRSLIYWLAKQGGQLHHEFVTMIDRQLSKLAQLESDGKITELNDIRVNAPNAIPDPIIRTYWSLLISNRIKPPRSISSLYEWKNHLDRDGLTIATRFELRELLMPKISINRPLRYLDESQNSADNITPPDVIIWELVLTADNVHTFFDESEQTESLQTILPFLLNDFQQLLHDALSLRQALGDSDDKNDGSYRHLPSISQHWQNRGFPDWVILIELLRDAWISTYKCNISQAARIAQNWFLQPYPTFKRLALFAATYDGVTPGCEWVDWLLHDDRWWLWSNVTKRETMRLFVQQGKNLNEDARKRLESAILAGPKRTMYPDSITSEQWQKIQDRYIWLRLTKLASNGCALSKNVSTKLMELSAANPEWILEPHEKEEFSYWMSSTGDPDNVDQIKIYKAPRTRRKLVEWLQEPLNINLDSTDDWRDICKEKFATAVCALFELGQNNIWPTERWRKAFQAWTDVKLSRRSWRYISLMLLCMPDNVLLTIYYDATMWLVTASKYAELYETGFFELCQRFFAIGGQSVLTGNVSVKTLNHPLGNVTQALLNHWLRSSPEDSQGLPEYLKTKFTLICETQFELYSDSRERLATHVIPLFRVDNEWAKKHLLRLFNWQLSENEAKAAWKGFLWSPRSNQQLLAAFKTDFLETANHYNDLCEYGKQYAAFLTYTALDQTDIFTIDELYTATSTLSKDGLVWCIHALINALQGSGEQREEYWNNRIRPYLQTIWPILNKVASKILAEQFARLAISARNEFPAALCTVQDGLEPLEDIYSVISLLKQSKLCTAFPKDALNLLSLIILNQPFAPAELRDCLEEIKQAYPESKQDNKFIRLIDYMRMKEE